jgi:hypothetical protein
MLGLFDLVSKVLFFNRGKRNKPDAASIPTAGLVTPHQNAAFLSIDTFPEPYNARMDRMICFDTDTNDTAVNDSGNMISQHEIMK